MEERQRFSGGQVVGILVAVLAIAALCAGVGLAVGGGAGLLAGGAAGYTLGQAQAEREEVPEEAPPEGPFIIEPPFVEEPRAWLGVRFEQTREGALIRWVEPDSPAEEAGLREGDLVLAVDGERVSPETPLDELIGAHEPGDIVELTIEREGEQLTLRVRLGERTFLEPEFEVPREEWLYPPQFPEEFGEPRAFLGVEVRQLEEGALVGRVLPGSPAEQAGLQEGDLIVAVDGEPVTEETPLVALVGEREPGNVVELTVEREGEELTLEVELAGRRMEWHIYPHPRFWPPIELEAPPGWEG